MLIRAYIEALLADERLAEEVWTVWDRGTIDDGLATITPLPQLIDSVTEN